MIPACFRAPSKTEWTRTHRGKNASCKPECAIRQIRRRSRAHRKSRHVFLYRHRPSAIACNSLRNRGLYLAQRRRDAENSQERNRVEERQAKDRPPHPILPSVLPPLRLGVSARVDPLPTAFICGCGVVVSSQLSVLSCLPPPAAPLPPAVKLAYRAGGQT